MASVEAVWPIPLALTGVKSRSKTVFKADKVAVSAEDGFDWNVTVAVNLESRIAAIGEGGWTSVALLLGRLQKDSGAVSQHPGLVVAHLGPHLAGCSATAETHAAAVATALKGKPHVVVLQEALAQGGNGWARTFHEIIRGQALALFKGAVVVACDQEATFAVRRVCVEQWVAPAKDRRVMQQDVTGRQWQIIEDALNVLCTEPPPNSGKVRGKKKAAAESQVDCLVDEARTLSEYWFEEDLIQVARDKGWTVALLTEAVHDGAGSLRGFIAYRFVQTAAGRELQIDRLGVSKSHCKRGLGSMLMRWLLGEAARMPQSECSMITTDALSNVVRFYRSLGFAENPTRQEHHTEGEDPNVFMELPNASLVAEHAVVPLVKRISLTLGECPDVALSTILQAARDAVGAVQPHSRRTSVVSICG